MKRHIKLLLIIFGSFLGSFLIVTAVFAALPFGGFVTGQLRCDNGLLLFVGPPRGGLFMLMPGAIIHPRGVPTSGKWVLGLYSPAGACVIVRPHSTTVIPARGTILRVGSS